MKGDPKYAKKSPLEWRFDSYEKVLSGQHTQAYKVTIKDRTWIIKEGIDSIPIIKLLNLVKISIPWLFFSPPLSVFNINVLPKPSNALKSFGQYLELARYLGYFTDKNTLERLKISKKLQKKMRNKVEKQLRKGGEFKKYIYNIINNDKNGYKILKKVWKEKKYRYTNFLPDEFLIIGHSSSSKKKQTYYIVQEYVKGEILGHINEELLNQDLISRLIILLSLILYMTFNNSILLDTRPENILLGITEWFRKTGNIIVNIKEGSVSVVDTRTVWHPRKAFMQRTMIIPSLIENSVCNALRHYLKLYLL